MTPLLDPATNIKQNEITLLAGNRTAIIWLFTSFLISIPVVFALVKYAPSRFDQKSEALKNDIELTEAKTSNPTPSISPLEELRGLLEASSAAKPTAAPLPAVSFGPTLNLKVNLEGRRVGNMTTKAFVGIAQGVATINPKYILTFTVNVTPSGDFNGLSLAGLTPGSTYTAYIKGSSQIDKAVTFVLGPATTSLNSGLPIELLSGDVNEDNVINSLDYTIVKNVLGTTSKSLTWNQIADINNDGVINSSDLSLVIGNLEKVGDSGNWYSTPPAGSSPIESLAPDQLESSSSANLLETGSNPSGNNRVGGYWIWIPPLDSAEILVEEN